MFTSYRYHMPLENLKISDDRSQELVKKMKEVKILDESTAVETASVAKNVIASLDKTKLATFIETQFKSWEKRKSYNEMVSDPMYVFSVQSALDALGYDALLTWDDNKYGIDEIYASRTRAAVSQFQKDAWFNGNDIDGYVWEKTFEALSLKLKDPNFVSKISVNKWNVPRNQLDAYGNALHYVTSISEIPVDKFNTPAWGNNVYVLNDYFIYGNGRVREPQTKNMLNWNDVKDKIISNPVVTPSTDVSMDTNVNNPSTVVMEKPLVAPVKNSEIDKNLDLDQSKITLALDSAKKFGPLPDNLWDVLPPVVWDVLNSAEKQQVTEEYRIIYNERLLIDNAKKDIKDVYSWFKTEASILKDLSKYISAKNPLIDAMILYHELTRSYTITPSSRILDTVILRNWNSTQYLASVSESFKKMYWTTLLTYIQDNYPSYFHSQREREQLARYERELKKIKI